MPWGSESDYGLRLDGTPKSKGWLGEIRMPDGITTMTEMSVGAPNTNETFRPSIVPGMHPALINYMRETGEVPEDALYASQRFAEQQLEKKQSPFYNSFFK